MEGAILLDGSLKSALSAVRSLGCQGVNVSVGSERRTAIARHSRYANRTFSYPSPYKNPEGFVERLKKEGETMGNKPLVYAFSDATYMLLARHRDALEPFVTLVLPAQESVEKAFDKAETDGLARSLSIPTIATYFPQSKVDLAGIYEYISYPAVVKARHTVSWKSGVGVFGTACFVHRQRRLEEMFERLRTTTGEAPLIQSFVKGDEYGVELLAYEGTVLAEVVHRRIRSLKPTGGASVVKETLPDTELTRTMRQNAKTLVESLQWTGPVMVEFKMNADDGSVKLMEINGRFWGSLPLAIAAGVDFPYLFYRLGRGERWHEVVSGHEGVTTRHFIGDMRNLLLVFFGRDKMRPYLYPSRIRALIDFIRPRYFVSGDVFAFDDLKPSFMEYVDVINRAL